MIAARRRRDRRAEGSDRRGFFPSGSEPRAEDPKKKISARLVFSRFFSARDRARDPSLRRRPAATSRGRFGSCSHDSRRRSRRAPRAPPRARTPPPPPRARPPDSAAMAAASASLLGLSSVAMTDEAEHGLHSPQMPVAARGDVRLVRSRVHPPRASGVPASLRGVPLSESRGVSQPRRRVLHRGGGQGARGRDRGTSSIAWHIATPLSPRFPASLSPRARGAAIVRRGGRARDRRARTRGGASRAADRAARRSIADGGKGCSLSVGRDRSVRTGAERTPDHGSRSAPRLDSGLAC